MGNNKYGYMMFGGLALMIGSVLIGAIPIAAIGLLMFIGSFFLAAADQTVSTKEQHEVEKRQLKEKIVKLENEKSDRTSL